MGAGGVVVTRWADAQRSVPIPLHKPSSPALSITVRRWSRNRWPTVCSLHRFHGSLIRVKQLVWGPTPSSFPPLLSYLAGGPNGVGDRPYGPTKVFRVGGIPIAHGTHYYGCEGGMAIAHMSLLDIIVREGKLGPSGLRAFLRGLTWAAPSLSEELCVPETLALLFLKLWPLPWAVGVGSGTTVP